MRVWTASRRRRQPRMTTARGLGCRLLIHVAVGEPPKSHDLAGRITDLITTIGHTLDCAPCDSRSRPNPATEVLKRGACFGGGVKLKKVDRADVATIGYISPG